MDIEKLTLRPRLRYQIVRIFISILCLYYAMQAFFNIPRRGIYFYEFWIPKNEWVRGNLMWLLKFNIPHDSVKTILYLIIGSILCYLGYYVLKTITTEFALTFKYIGYTHGIVVKTHDTVDMVVVKDQEFKQTIFERLLGLCSLKIISSDFSHPELKIIGISKKDGDKALEFLRMHSSRSIVDYRMTQDMIKSKKKARLIEEDSAED